MLTVNGLIQSSPIILAEYRESPANQANLQAKSLLIEDRQVSVNAFFPEFDPERPIAFQVTIQISKGNQFLFIVLDSLFQELGKVTRRHIGPGVDKHRIIVLLETQVRQWKSSILFQISATQEKIIPIEIIDKQPRCCICFSPTHVADRCFQGNGGVINTRLHRQSPSLATGLNSKSVAVSNRPSRAGQEGREYPRRPDSVPRLHFNNPDSRPLCDYHHLSFRAPSNILCLLQDSLSDVRNWILLILRRPLSW